MLSSYRFSNYEMYERLSSYLFTISISKLHLQDDKENGVDVYHIFNRKEYYVMFPDELLKQDITLNDDLVVLSVNNPTSP